MQNVCLLLSGTLSANVTVYLPASVSGFYIVNNSTSGSYDVTMLSAGGSPGRGVIVGQGQYTLIWSDGSNVDLATNATLSAGSGITITGGTINVDAPLATTYGGTGVTGPYTNGQLLIGNTLSGTLTPATLTAGANVTITNGNGTITIAASGGGSGSFDPAISYTFTGTETFNGTTSSLAAVLANAAETTTVSATAATGTINYDTTTQSVLYYTTNASGNWTLNIRGNSSTSLNTFMATNQSITIAFLVTQGSPAFYQSALTIDGSSVTPKWQGGTAPTSGNASGVDIYTVTVIKTGSATYTAFASQTQFA